MRSKVDLRDRIAVIPHMGVSLVAKYGERRGPEKDVMVERTNRRRQIISHAVPRMGTIEGRAQLILSAYRSSDPLSPELKRRPST